LPLFIENTKSSLEKNKADRIATVGEQIEALQHELSAMALPRMPVANLGWRLEDCTKPNKQYWLSKPHDRI